eukprot:scaffold54930_cov19-Tisochrysis_lutea.AAC.1
MLCCSCFLFRTTFFVKGILGELRPYILATICTCVGTATGIGIGIEATATGAGNLTGSERRSDSARGTGSGRRPATRAPISCRLRR